MHKISTQRNRSSGGPMTAYSRTRLDRCAIERVAHHWMAQRRHMDSDLMGSAGVNLHLQQRKPSVARIYPSHNSVVSYCLTSDGPAPRHTGSAPRVTSYPTAYRATILAHASVHQGKIILLRLPCRKLGGELAVRLVVFRNHQKSAGLFVKPMHNPGPQVATYARQTPETM